MMDPLNMYDSKTESQPCQSCQNDLHGEITSAIQAASHFSAFENIYTSPVFTNNRNYDVCFPNNTWASEAPPELESQFAGDIYSPPIPTHYISTPFTSFSDSVDPISPNGWQLDASHFMQENSGMPWWWNPRAGSGNDDPTFLSERNLRDGNSTTESTSVSGVTTDLSQHINREDSPPPPIRPTKKSVMAWDLL